MAESCTRQSPAAQIPFAPLIICDEAENASGSCFACFTTAADTAAIQRSGAALDAKLFSLIPTRRLRTAANWANPSSIDNLIYFLNQKLNAPHHYLSFASPFHYFRIIV